MLKIISSDSCFVIFIAFLILQSKDGKPGTVVQLWFVLKPSCWMKTTSQIIKLILVFPESELGEVGVIHTWYYYEIRKQWSFLRER